MPRQIKELGEKEIAELVFKIKTALASKWGGRRVQSWITNDIELTQAFLKETWLQIRTKLELEDDRT